MYSMYISPNQCKYSEFKNDLNIAVYTQTLGKSFAHQLVLSFDMLPFPKGDCLIQVWLHLVYFYVLHPQHIHEKNFYHLSLTPYTLILVCIFS